MDVKCSNFKLKFYKLKYSILNLKNYTCDIFYEKFPFAILTQNSDVSLCLNPLSSWSLSSSNQLVNIDVYHRLVKQEMIEIHSSTSGNSANKDHFQALYQNLSESEMSEFRGLACSINEMLDFLEAKDDLFTLGVLSTIIANEINQSSDAKIRRKV